MGRFKRKHKTLSEAKKALAKANEGFSKNHKIFKLKNASVWKYLVATELEWLHGLY